MQCEPGGEDEGWGGAYAARILQRAKPADMPIERPSRVEMVINLKTAKVVCAGSALHPPGARARLSR